MKPHQAILALYNEVLLDIRGERVKANHNEADKLEEDLKKLQERINRVNDIYFDGEISKTEKEDNLNRYGKEAERLQDRIQTLRISEDLQVKDKLTYSINLIDNLGQFFRWAKPEVKIKLLGSMFHEKIEFDGKIIEPRPTTRCSTSSSRKPSNYEEMQKWSLQKLLEIPLWYPRGESNAIVRTVIR